MKSIHEPRLSKEELESMNPMNYNGVIPPSNFKKVMFNLTTKCLLCENKAIGSHTISNNWMKKIFKSGYISTVLQDEHGNYVLQKIPINDASVFPLRCEYHDNEIFKEIDNNIDLNNEYHLNLLTYKSLAREFRIQIGRIKILYSFIYHNLATHLKDLLCEYNKRTSETYNMMKYVEHGIRNTTRRGLKHKIFKLGRIEPVFLSSAVNPNHHKDWSKTWQTCVLNIIIIDNEGYFILSYKEYDKDSEKLYKKINKTFKDGNIIPFLNEFIGKNCQNIICDEKRDGEIIQTPEDGRLYENGAHDYIRLID